MTHIVHTRHRILLIRHKTHTPLNNIPTLVVSSNTLQVLFNRILDDQLMCPQ